MAKKPKKTRIRANRKEQLPPPDDGLTCTRGNVIINHIQVGDVHYEFIFSGYIKSEVITAPERKEWPDGDVTWSWKSRDLRSGEIIEYSQSHRYQNHGLVLYDYLVYEEAQQV